jgi:hypothetical protein
MSLHDFYLFCVAQYVSIKKRVWFSKYEVQKTVDDYLLCYIMDQENTIFTKNKESEYLIYSNIMYKNIFFFNK